MSLIKLAFFESEMEKEAGIPGRKVTSVASAIRGSLGEVEDVLPKKLRNLYARAKGTGQGVVGKGEHELGEAVDFVSKHTGVNNKDFMAAANSLGVTPARLKMALGAGVIGGGVYGAHRMMK